VVRPPEAGEEPLRLLLLVEPVAVHLKLEGPTTAVRWRGIACSRQPAKSLAMLWSSHGAGAPAVTTLYEWSTTVHVLRSWNVRSPSFSKGRFRFFFAKRHCSSFRCYLTNIIQSWSN
jgi:hypothetical protein